MKEIKNFDDLKKQFTPEEYVKMFVIAVCITVFLVLITGANIFLGLLIFIAIFGIQFYLGMLKAKNKSNVIDTSINTDNTPNDVNNNNNNSNDNSNTNTL